MRSLIVNADDLGLAPGVTQGILELARGGGVTSASALMNLPESRAALDAAQGAGLDVGVHLNLCSGAPLSPPHTVSSTLSVPPTLPFWQREREEDSYRRAVAHACPPGPPVGTGAHDRPATGETRFATAGAIVRRLHSGRLRLDEVEREWAAQIELSLAGGLRPSHLDSHCHLHAYPGLYHLTIGLARRYGIPGVRNAGRGFILHPPRLHVLRLVLGRGRSPIDAPYHSDHFSVLTVMGYTRASGPLETLLRRLPPGVTELVCHPGHVDDALRRIDPLTDAREREWLLLSRLRWRDILARHGIRLTSWAEVVRWRGWT